MLNFLVSEALKKLKDVGNQHEHKKVGDFENLNHQKAVKLSKN